MTDSAEAGPARINGQPVSFQNAISAAATLLAASRSAVVAGLGTDVAGARASVALARAIGASLDHMEAEAMLANLDVMRRSGWIVTTPLQTRARADTVLLVGDGLLEAWPEIIERLALGSGPTLGSTGEAPGQDHGGQVALASSEVPGGRRVIHLCAGASPAATSRRPSTQVSVGPATRAVQAVARPARAAERVSGGPATRDMRVVAEGKPVLATLAALRAIVAGRRTSLDEAAAAPLGALASALTEARFGVVIWSAAALDTLAIEMLCGLIDDLNKTTRFAGLPLAQANGAEAVAQALASATGFPLRIGLASTAPLHDPWRFDAARLIASGEADAAIWVSALSPMPQPWGSAVPTVALVLPGTAFQSPPAVVFEIGCPGRDHDAMLFDPAPGGIVFAAASAPSDIASVARVLTGITAALPSC